MESIAVKRRLESKMGLSAALKMEAQPSGKLAWGVLQDVHGESMRSKSIGCFKGIVVKAVCAALGYRRWHCTDESGPNAVGLKRGDVGHDRPYVKPAADVVVQEFLQNISNKNITWTELNNLGVDMTELRWQCIGDAQPAVGRRLTNSGLSNALKTKTDPDDLAEFTQEQWSNFDITDFQFDDFLQSGDFFFQPTVAKGVTLNREMLSMYMALRRQRVTVDVFLHRQATSSRKKMLNITVPKILNFTVKVTAEERVLSDFTQSAFIDHLRHYLRLDLPGQFPKDAITRDVRASRKIEDPLFKPSDWQVIIFISWSNLSHATE